MVRALEGGNADYEALFWLAAGVIARLTNDSVMLGRIAKKGGGSGGAVRRRAQRKGSGIMTISTRG